MKKIILGIFSVIFIIVMVGTAQAGNGTYVGGSVYFGRVFSFLT